MSVVLVALGLIVLLLVVVTVYYALRLLKVSRGARDSASRFQAFVRQQSLMQARMEALGGKAAGSEGIAGAPEVGESTGNDIVSCPGVGLSGVSSEAVFLARGPAGEVSVQMGNKPPVPLNYVLEPRLRQVLQLIVSQATLSFGYSWSVLANEDTEGKLRLQRLS